MAGPVVISGRRVLPVAAMRERAARLASGLRRMGVGPGDRYAIVMRNETGFLEATFAASFIGAVPVPVNWHWTGADLRHLLHDSKSVVALVHSDLIPAVEARKPEHLRIVEVAVPPEVAEEFGVEAAAPSGRYPTVEQLVEDNDPPAESVTTPPMSVIYTSGTTGLAKGVLRNPIPPEKTSGIVDLMRQVLGFRPGGTAVIPAPLYHTAPNVAATFALAMGMNVVIMTRFDAEHFLRLVEENGVTAAQMVPTMFTRLLRLPREVRAKYDLSSLESVSHSAAPCPPDVKRAMIDWFGPIITEYYGGSEGGGWTFCTSDQWLAHPGTVGSPVGDAAIRILGPDLAEVPVGGTGVVYGRSPSAWPDFTYIGDDAKRSAIDGGDGFYTLGDVGRLDEDGYLHLTDRLDDMVISGGVNIYPAEIETTLMGLEGVADVAVFGIPDVDFGEALAAHVELLPDATVTAEQVRAHVRRNLAAYKVPKVVVFDDELPREDSGKLFKRRLRELYRPIQAGSPPRDGVDPGAHQK